MACRKEKGEIEKLMDELGDPMVTQIEGDPKKGVRSSDLTP